MKLFETSVSGLGRVLAGASRAASASLWVLSRCDVRIEPRRSPPGGLGVRVTVDLRAWP